MKQRPYLLLMRRFWLWLRQSVAFLWLVVVAGYLMVQAGQAFYQNYQSQQTTQSLQADLAQKELEKERLQALLVYYQTDSYKEKELRQELLYKRPDEKVYALPESGLSVDLANEVVSTGATKPAPPKPANEPIWRQWVNYLMYPQKNG
ncbi:septum formation initiator family protein [Patescibacteria group bacterium]|nr:septum formation initiator family protein [Patescibacteria group bacterium]